jgi:hypothetical protein
MFDIGIYFPISETNYVDSRTNGQHQMVEIVAAPTQWKGGMNG